MRTWDMVSRELFHIPLRPDWNRPVSEIRDAVIEVITLMARNEFPLPVPPLWVAELICCQTKVSAPKFGFRFSGQS